MGNIDDNDSTTSSIDSDEALLDMLGLSSLKKVPIIADECDNDDEDRLVSSSTSQAISNHKTSSPLPDISDDCLISTMAPLARETYLHNAIFRFPENCWIPAKHMRVLTEQIVRGWKGPSGNLHQADKSYEGIKIWKDGEILERKTLTRLENFVDTHPGWSELCHGYLRRILSAALGEEMVLFKEKLNLKPPGGR
jgi:hypothetical protein